MSIFGVPIYSLLIVAGGFSDDFSIIATIRPQRGQEAILFAIYSEDATEQLSLTVGAETRFLYSDRLTWRDQDPGQWNERGLNLHADLSDGA